MRVPLAFPVSCRYGARSHPQFKQSCHWQQCGCNQPLPTDRCVSLRCPPSSCVISNATLLTYLRYLHTCVALLTLHCVTPSQNFLVILRVQAPPRGHGHISFFGWPHQCRWLWLPGRYQLCTSWPQKLMTELQFSLPL